MSPAPVSNDELLDALRDLADDLGHTPRCIDVREHTKHSSNTYVDRFGGWLDALEAAGLDPDREQTIHLREVDREAFIEDLRRVADELGRSPLSTEYREHGEYSPDHHRKVDDSWDGTLDAAGLDPDEKPAMEISREELIDELQIATEAIGRPPDTKEMNEFGEFSAATYYKEFGSWEAAKEAAGVADE